MTNLRLGTRGSPLALAQSKQFAKAFKAVHPDVNIEIITIKTTGDKLAQARLDKIGGKGVFIKEIEEALLEGSIDFAVHSYKDMPATCPEGLEIICVPAREDPQDALISHHASHIAALAKGAVVGTSSPRRGAQIQYLRPDVEIVLLRGNVGTRLKKLKEGRMDATILAQAGLNRLGIQESFIHPIGIDNMVPAIAQGALCIQARSKDQNTRALLAPLSDPDTQFCTDIERLFLPLFDAGCHTPLGVHAALDGNKLAIHCFIASEDKTRMAQEKITCDREEGIHRAKELAQKLLTMINV